jgi:hypothetical protein
MKLSRKSFLKLLAGALLVPGVYYLRKLFFVTTDQAPARSASFDTAVASDFLEAVVGLIAPRQVPVALDHHAIAAKVIADAKQTLADQARPEDAVRLLNTAAKRDHHKMFADLSREQMQQVLTKVLQSVSLESYLLIMLREEVMKEYYSHPSVWKYLGQAHPPQPYGYLDYDKPPASSTHG